MPTLTATRRLVLGGLFATALAPAGSNAEPPRDVTAAEDFDELWRTLGERYCFFSEKRTDWGAVRRLYRPRALASGSVEDFQEVVRQVLGELYDAHTHLSSPPDGSPRYPYFDLWVERADNGARITDVREGSAAKAAGLLIGDVVIAVGAESVFQAAAAAAPRCLARPDPAADAYALNVAVSGRRAQPRRLGVFRDGVVRTVDLPLLVAPAEPDVSSRGLEGGFGLIRIASFANNSAIAAFDAALAYLRETRGLILEVPPNGGGDTAVARPIMGRFITEPRPYAHMRRRAGAGLSAPWTETVESRGPFTYTRPVVVLCDRWSGSMAEGFPMGMRGIGRARVVGTPMMGLGAAVFEIRLDRTGVEAQYSGEPVYDVAGAPRWRLRPDVEVRPGADILAAGLAELSRIAGPA
jgi:carboxyl-terminal processing protease